MRTWSFVLGGALSLAAAAVLVSLSFAVPNTFAGISTSTPVTCGTPIPLGQITAFQQLPTCTPVRKVNTATPTLTATVEASATPVSPTQAPPTQAPPTATQPAGGSGGQAVTPPNTGSGPDAASSNVYMLLAAGLAAAMGAGSMAVGVKRRR